MLLSKKNILRTYQERNNETRHRPVNYLPSKAEISHNLHGNQHILIDVDDANHLMQELSCVIEKLFNLKVAFQLMKFLNLTKNSKTIYI